HEFRTARLGGCIAEDVVHGAFPHRELVDGELRMAGDAGGAGGLFAGLEVDDIGTAFGVALHTVHGTPDAHREFARLQGDVEVALARDRCAAGAVGDVPAEEAFECGARVLLLLGRLPGRVEGERVPDRVEAFHQRVQVGGGVPGGDLVGQDV